MVKGLGGSGDQPGTPRSGLPPHSFETQEIPLPPPLDEFRIALKQEIDAARKNASSSAVPLSNGRRIASVLGSFQYLFSIDNVLNAPNDAPGELIVSGIGRVEATIISVDGLAVTLSVPQDLGEFVPFARLQSDLSFLLRKLIERLEAWGHRENPAGTRLLGSREVSGEPTALGIVDGFNEDQRKAVASALGRDTTFIWGPPGTGKTRTIGWLGNELLKAKRSLLLVSHTNIALDQALLSISDPKLGNFEDGAVIRVGEPRDKQLLKRPELLLKTQVQKKSAELTTRRNELEAEREAKSKEVVRLQDMIALMEWVTDAAADIRAMESGLQHLHEVEAQAQKAAIHLPDAVDEIRRWEDTFASAAETQKLQKRLEKEVSGLQSTQAEINKNEAALADARSQLKEAVALLEQAQGLESRRARLEQLSSLGELRSDFERKRTAAMEARSRRARVESMLEDAQSLLIRAESAGALMRLWKRLPKPEEQQQIVASLDKTLLEAGAILEQVEADFREAEGLWSEAFELTQELKPFRDVRRASTQLKVVERLRREDARLIHCCEELSSTVITMSHAIEDLTKQVEAFIARFGMAPQALALEAEAKLCDLRAKIELAKSLSNSAAKARTTLEEKLQNLLSALEQWGLVSGGNGDAETRVKVISAAHERAEIETAGYDVNKLHAEIDTLNGRIRQIGDEIGGIDEALKQVEELVIAQAVVVATTLTGAYLRDSIQKRRFDTVLLDEASMAPIPALWVAASLADSNVAVVGDFRQLPPVVQSEDALSKKWLGKDIFEISGMRKAYDESVPPVHFVELRMQYRMAPSICDIPNALFYDGKLVTIYSSEKHDKELYKWYIRTWGEDCPLSVVDTGGMGAWVTSVTRGGSPSRLNFLSATVCVDLVEQMLKSDRPKAEPGDPARVLIICPYSPHARLLKLLLREDGLEGEVNAGTVHSFQGSEADVVVLDLVNDEPHWRVNICNPENDETTRRLFNVALTRARSRLIIVGNLKYIEKISKNAFLGQLLIPSLRAKAGLFDALHMTKAGFAGRAAASQIAVLGGEVEAPHQRIVVKQDDFYRYLLQDLQHATKRVVIYSPFITEARVGALEPALKACIERGVRVYVVTKTIGERPILHQSTVRRIEKALGDWGVIVIHKRNMHEKLVFVDEDILWSGSLNPLSYTDTQEVMERRFSPKVVSDYAETLKVAKLVGAIDAGETDCPICGSEIIASEGRNDPFYWRCAEDDCFSRSIGQPMPTDGRITCSNCGASVEFGEWGDRPAWRCTANARHRQPIVRSHLKLPKMRELIPSRRLRKLQKSFGMTESDPTK